MRIRFSVGTVVIGALALVLAGMAATASAQTGGVRGKIVDESGKPMDGVTVVLDSPEGLGTVTLKTNSKGEFFSIGMRPGDYTVKATKDKMSASLRRVHIGLGDPTNIETLTMRSGASAAAADMSAEEAAKAKKKQEELQAAFRSAQAAADAGNFDDAIAQFTKVAGDVTKCTVCYLRLGEVNAKKGDAAAAEAAYLKAIEIDPASPDGYNALASFYNTQKKFDEAGKMSAKAAELSSSSTGGSDPLAVYNQAIILWNQRKAAEAQALFQKVTELDPKNADAFYFLGMTLVSQAKMADAKKPFDTYLQLAPTGPHAEEVKTLLPYLK
jgi:tetratricopeptide (TPR) repeat protein